MAETTHGTAPVTDHRPVPRGVLPRRTQMWLMLGLACGILAIILVAGGQPDSAARPVTPSTTSPLPVSADRLRDYQDRLRVLDARARQEPVTQPVLVGPRPASDDARPVAAPDPVEAERRRRAYESLFASNIVTSRRPEAHVLVPPGRGGSPAQPTSRVDDGLPMTPSLDDVADAVVRASTRYQPPAPDTPPPQTGSERGVIGSATAAGPGSAARRARPAATEPMLSSGPLHRILEGTVIETVLTNRLDGGGAAPVNCLVTTSVYSHDGQVVLIPAGSRVLGETTPVQGFGDTRLAVAFHRLALPDGRTYPLEHFVGLNAIGDAGLRDRVNQHYRSTFGASAAVGLITGFAQVLGSLGLTRGTGDRTVVVAGQVGDATAQATAHTMNRFLNRLPTITIREGHRVLVYLTSDLELPAFDGRTGNARPLQAGVR